MKGLPRTFVPALAVAVLSLAACRQATTPQDGSASVLISGYNGTFSYDLDVGEGSHDVYFVFTNTNLVLSTDAATVSGLTVDGKALPALRPQPAGGPSEDSASLKDRIAYDNRTLFSRLGAGVGAVARDLSASSGPEPSEPVADMVDQTGSLVSWAAAGMGGVASTCRSVTTLATDQGDRTLNIWVANDCWVGTSTKKHSITQTMVDTLAAKFLASGSDNDIYDWVTDILGPEWAGAGITADPSLIPGNGEITILLSDIQGDNADDGGVVGYFYSLNNFLNSALVGTQYEGLSNQRVMFVIDAVMYANPDDDGHSVDDAGYYSDNGWSSGDYWAEEIYSTLAHEFQHMIHFYRKGIVARGDGASAETWIDEMCAQLVEDLVAAKQGVMGPRGVVSSDGTAGSSGNTNGRIPAFNQYLSLGLSGYEDSADSYDVEDYSFSYSFGAWLLRNYGGAQFVKDVVWDTATDSQAIVDAVKACSGRTYTFPGLLQRWAVSVLGSSRTDMPPGFRYNTGASFPSTSALDATAGYSVGSIDFFNYAPAPAILTPSTLVDVASFPAASSLYYKAASGLSGSRSFRLHLPAGVAFSVYVTP